MPLWWSSRMMNACMTTHSWWPVSSCPQSPENAELSYKACVWCTHDALCLCLWHGSVLPVPQRIECRQGTVYSMTSTRLQHNFCLSVHIPTFVQHSKVFFIQSLLQPRQKHFLCLVFYRFCVDWSVGHTNVDGNTWGIGFIYNYICASVYVYVFNLLYIFNIRHIYI